MQMLDADEFAAFCTGIRRLWGIDLTSYGERQLHRRLRAMMARVNATVLADFLQQMQADASLSEQFKNKFTINVSEFFRNPELFSDLEEMLRPGRVCSDAKKIWSAGCSYGAEPYTLAILMDEYAQARKWEILASDIDAEALASAKTGIFTERDLRHVSLARRRKYFEQTDAGTFAVSDKLKRNMHFFSLDLLQPGKRMPRDCDLVLCRNVIIYFNSEAKKQVQSRLAEALRPGGVLLIGGTERVANPEAAGLSVLRPFFYRKAEAA